MFFPINGFSFEGKNDSYYEYKDIYDKIYEEVHLPPLPGLSDSFEEFIWSSTSSSNLGVEHSKFYNQISSPSYEIENMIQDLTPTMYLEYLEGLCSFSPRQTGSDLCYQAGIYLYQEFEKLGIDVRFHNWTRSSSVHGSNIEATIPGVHPNSDEIYLICGHYDTVPPSPGADDDGSGVVAALSSAAVLSQYHFNHTLRFVVFPGEEQGLVGSGFYAREAYENNDNIMGILNADMIGYTRSEEGERKVIIFDNEDSKWLTDFSIDVCEIYNHFFNLEMVPGGYSGRSDHASFYPMGYHAIFFHEYEFNPNYHSRGDDIKTMNIHYATNVTKLMLATLAELSEPVGYQAPEKPEKPNGPHSGSPMNTYEYEFTTSDPDGDQLSYLVDWGDGTDSGWIGQIPSGEVSRISHSWDEEGDYEIKVKAQDSYHLESPWSESLSITMPKAKNALSLILSKILDRNSIVFTLLHLLSKKTEYMFQEIFLI
jgi:hypothetical protein